MRFERKLARWLVRRTPVVRRMVPRRGPERGRVDHIVILDGTNSTLVPGNETNAGIAYKLLRETAPRVDLNLHYEAGVPWNSWRATLNVIYGTGINGQIKRAYGAVSSRYQPGDRLFFIGFSRGAYAVRSLAGIIGMVGLLKSEHATERNIREVFRHYEIAPSVAAAREFKDQFCQSDVEIEVVAVWDTVKSLGLRAPYLWRLTEDRYRFHNHALAPHVKNGFHALALDENREAFAPVMWETPENHEGHIEQAWFRGAHSDVGGHLGGFNEARPRSNVPLVWLLKRVEACGAALPDAWEKRFEQDPFAPAHGTRRGWGRAFLARKRRVVGQDASEVLHPSVIAIAEAGGKSAPALPVVAT